MQMIILCGATAICFGMVLWVKYDQTHDGINEWKKRHKD